MGVPPNPQPRSARFDVRDGTSRQKSGHVSGKSSPIAYTVAATEYIMDNTQRIRVIVHACQIWAAKGVAGVEKWTRGRKSPLLVPFDL